ncbi:MAG TPA: hypothetical protein VMX55_11930 [candidate division Zixibacteria bacterium]|nr:hypothetical protein [candidate division Zixibacteria bacterium]
MEDLEIIFNSFEKACSAGDFTSAESLIQQLEELSTKDDTANIIYSKAVVKAIDVFKGRFSSIKLKKLLANVERIVGTYPNEKELVNNYAKALRFSLSAMSTKGQPNVMKEIIGYLENLALSNPDNIVIYEELSQASHEIVDFWKKRGDFQALRNRTSKFRELVKKFPNNELIKLNLSKSLVDEIDSSNKRDIEKVDNLLLEIQQLSESMPMNIGLQLEWVHAYRTAMDRTKEKPDYAHKWLNSMKEIVANKKDDAFKIELAKGYINAISLGELKQEELVKYLDEIEKLAVSIKENRELQAIYSQSLIIALQYIGIQDYTKTQKILKDMQKLVDEFSDDELIVNIYVEALTGVIGLLVQDQKADEIVALLNELERLDKEYPKNEFIQQTFDQLSSVLKMIGFKRTKEKPKRMDYL